MALLLVQLELLVIRPDRRLNVPNVSTMPCLCEFYSRPTVDQLTTIKCTLETEFMRIRFILLIRIVQVDMVWTVQAFRMATACLDFVCARCICYSFSETRFLSHRFAV